MSQPMLLGQPLRERALAGTGVAEDEDFMAICRRLAVPC